MNPEATHSAGLQVVDWVIIGLYAAMTIAIGWYFGRRQRSTAEYFVGNRQMSPLLIGVSLFVTLLSTISYLSKPGEAVGKGPVMTASLFALPFVYLIVGYAILPFYMQRRAISAYELLEAKMGVGIRLLAASMFLVLRLFWMSLLIFLAAEALTVMMGVDVRYIPVIVLVTGFIAVIYTSLGGLQAVVVTDFLQTLLLFGGALLAIGFVTYQMGGVTWFPTQWHPNWDHQPVFSFDPRVRVTAFGSVMMVLTWYVCTGASDQTSVQRFMATKDAAAARRALATQLISATLVSLILVLVGFALLGYFETHPELLPPDMSLKANADRVFPHFIAYCLPAGISGLVVAAMFAAAMSSIDSGVNSITAVVTTDFLERFGKKPATEKGQMLFAKLLALAVGTIVVMGSTLVGQIPGNITAVTYKTVNLLTTPIFGLFFYALFLPFARPAGAWAGTVIGIVTAAVIAFSGPIVTLLDQHFGIPAQTFGVALQTVTDKYTGQSKLAAPDPISFQWIGPVALAANLAVGTAVSWVLSRNRR